MHSHSYLVNKAKNSKNINQESESNDIIDINNTFTSHNNISIL